MINARTSCRVCGGLLYPVLDLGNLRLNAFPASLEELTTVPRAPHCLTLCQRCSLAQLAHTVNPDVMYREYWYRSSVNEMMVAELQSIVRHVQTLVHLQPGDAVVDIGANDGTLLAQYAELRNPMQAIPTRIAVEPARNLHTALSVHCDVLVPDYFPTTELAGLEGQCKAVTAIAMCYDLEDPVGFFIGIRNLLAPRGVAIVQFQDMGQMLEAAAFDNIVPEHLEYYTLGSLMQALAPAGLTAVDVLTTPINGGSLRVVLRRTVDVDRLSVFPSITDQLVKEERLGLATSYIAKGYFEAYDLFARRVHAAQEQIAAAVAQVVEQGAILDILGASTKGNMMCQVLRLGPGEIRQAIDRSHEKEGRLTVTGIPIVGEGALETLPPGAALVNIWQFRESVLNRYGSYLEKGGQLIFPLPRVEIVAKGWTQVGVPE